jgi:hypothetical protein
LNGVAFGGTPVKVLARKNRFYDTGRFGQPEIRVYHRSRRGKKCPRYLLKCGCCDNRLEILYSVDGLEVGGVNGAIADWREILLPLFQAGSGGAGAGTRRAFTRLSLGHACR